MTTDLSQSKPDRLVSVRELFGIDSNMQVPAFSERDEHVRRTSTRCIASTRT